MKTISIERGTLIFGAAVWWLLFVLLSVNQFNPFEILSIFGFLTLSLLPGILTLVTLRLRRQPFWGYFVLAIGFSLLELIIIALIGNTLWPLIGIIRPLDAPVLLEDFSLFITLLLCIIYVRMGHTPIRLVISFFDNVRDRILAFTPAVFIVMSIAGAFRLNNGTGGTATLIMLLGIAGYAALLTYYSDKVGPSVIPTALFFIATALLLMNSLRGWYITGHDIQKEYRVFELTKSNGIWAIANFRDAYNACMSITILPTIFSNLLPIFDPYIYKLLFQLLFATAIPIIYLNVRRYVSAVIAFIATFYFIAFPTFYTDMSFLNRQEIAFIFLTLMIYVIFEKGLSLSIRRTLFMLFGIGMVLSHYSTTYTIVIALIFLACMQPIIIYAGPSLRKIRWFTNSGIPALGVKDFVYKPLITFWMVLILVAATFLWSSVLTNTAAGSFSLVIKATLAAMESNTKEDAQSSDVSSSLLSYGKTDYNKLFQNYETQIILPTRAVAPPGTYYDTSVYEKYPTTVAPDEVVPLTPLGNFLSSKGVNLSNDNYIFRQASAKLLQILIVVGFISIMFSNYFIDASLDMEFILLSVASLIMLVAIVVLPVLSVEYGVLRAFQQSLMFLGLFLVIGNLAPLIKYRRRIALIASTTILLLFFLSESGAITQIFGGYDPQLNLNNNGLYYDIYYSHESEIVGIDWLSNAAQEQQGLVQAPTQTDFYTVQKVTSISDLDPSSDIYPGLVRKNSYVFLGYTTVHKQQATITYDGTQITYTYPIQFLDDNKNLIYNNGDVKIYR